MAASSTDLVVNIIGNAQSGVRAFNDVGDAAAKQSGKFDKFKTGVTIATGVMVAAVAKFGSDSIQAYSEAEQSQAQLTAAYEKFPAVASVSIDALRELNTEIQHKTGYDDDQLAAAQANLAQFGLTGEQIQKLTPLMADYAAKTGKDLVTASTDMGKAVMGQGRALKNVGVDFKDTKDAGANFEQLIEGLDGTVGGFAATMGDTAAGKAQILETNFGDLQETVGQMLIPALTSLTDIGIQVTEWLSANPEIVQILAVAIGVLTAAFIGITVATWALNTALLANPITWIILAIVALIGVIVLLVLNWDAVVKWVTEIWGGFISWITGVIDGFVKWWNAVWAAVGKIISDIWNTWIVGPIRTAINWIANTVAGFLVNLKRGWELAWASIGNFVKGVWNGLLGWIEGGVNGAINLINGMINAIRGPLGVVGIEVATIPNIHIPRLASGTVTSGPMLSIIGDNPGGREVVEPLDSYRSELRRAYDTGTTRNGGRADTVELGDRTMDALAARVYTLIMTGVNKGLDDAAWG